ncbi:hypothetical protein V8C42DRAFT_311402 [Trichoderma barbatum]
MANGASAAKESIQSINPSQAIARQTHHSKLQADTVATRSTRYPRLPARTEPAQHRDIQVSARTRTSSPASSKYTGQSNTASVARSDCGSDMLHASRAGSMGCSFTSEPLRSRRSAAPAELAVGTAASHARLSVERLLVLLSTSRTWPQRDYSHWC